MFLCGCNPPLEVLKRSVEDIISMREVI